MRNTYFVTWLLCILWIFIRDSALAQSASITYTTPQSYQINSSIPVLSPTNMGGAVPATVYGTVTTYAGNGTVGSANGTALSAQFGHPTDVAADAQGNVYVAELNYNRLRKIAPDGTVSTLTGTSSGFANGPVGSATFNGIYKIALDNAGNLYAADVSNYAIRKITPSGMVSTYAGTGVSGSLNGPVNTAQFNLYANIAFDGSGNMFVTDYSNYLLRKVTAAANVVSTFAGVPGIRGHQNGAGLTATFNNTADVAVDGSGNLFVCDVNGGDIIRKVTPAGVVSTFAGSGAPTSTDGNGIAASFVSPVGITIDPTGNLYVVEQGSNKIRRISNAGQVVTIAGSGTAARVDGIGTSASFNLPSGIDFDHLGNLYVSESGSYTIRKIVITGYTIDRPLPAGLAFDLRTGTISGTPSVVSPATNYIITAYNAGGSNSTVVNIEVKAVDLIFGPLAAKTICDPDFAPGATGAGTIIYTSGNIAVATILAGKIHITGAGTALITADNGSSHLTQLLTVNTLAAPTVIIAAPVGSPCENTPLTYIANATNAGANPTYRWTLNGLASGNNNPVYSSSLLINGDVLNCTVINNDNCIPVSSLPSTPVSVIVLPMSIIDVSIKSSVSVPVCTGTQITFTATPSANTSGTVTYQWQLNGQNVGSNLSTFTSNLLHHGDQVTCTITASGTCLVNASVTSNKLVVSLLADGDCTLSIPNTFTPNGDGYNDTWEIILPRAYQSAVIRIFDRGGQLVFRSAGYTIPWNGTINGKALPVGTYYYLIDPQNNRQKLSGSVNIIK